MTSVSEMLPYLLPVIVGLVPASAHPTAPRSLPEPRQEEPVRSTQAIDGSGFSVDQTWIGTTSRPIQPLAAAVVPSVWLDAAVEKLGSYSAVYDGWKGDLTRAPSTVTLVSAKQLISQFASEVSWLPQPLISADEDGAVCFHWALGDFTATVSAHDDGTYSFFAEKGKLRARSNSEVVGLPLPSELVAVLTAA